MAQGDLVHGLLVAGKAVLALGAAASCPGRYAEHDAAEGAGTDIGTGVGKDTEDAEDAEDAEKDEEDNAVYCYPNSRNGDEPATDGSQDGSQDGN